MKKILDNLEDLSVESSFNLLTDFLKRVGAGIIIGLVESLGGLLIDPSFKLLYVFVIYLLVVIYRPQGLFGRY